MSGRSRTQTPTSAPHAAAPTPRFPGGLLERRRLLTAAGAAGATAGLGVVLGPAGGSATAGP
ncbi:hypothetical protein ACWGJA_27730, partial [Streptomyces sp. NPDC054784]